MSCGQIPLPVQLRVPWLAIASDERGRLRSRTVRWLADWASGSARLALSRGEIGRERTHRTMKRQRGEIFCKRLARSLSLLRSMPRGRIKSRNIVYEEIVS